MSQKARLLPTSFLVGMLAGGAAALFLTPHSTKGARMRAHAGGRPVTGLDRDGLGTWSSRFAARQVAGQDLGSAPMGWY
jgi:hypothetical protein